MEHDQLELIDEGDTRSRGAASATPMLCHDSADVALTADAMNQQQQTPAAGRTKDHLGTGVQWKSVNSILRVIQRKTREPKKEPRKRLREGQGAINKEEHHSIDEEEKIGGEGIAQ